MTLILMTNDFISELIVVWLSAKILIKIRTLSTDSATLMWILFCFQIVFAPKEAGEFVAKLNVTSSLMVSDQPLVPARYPTVVTLRATAELPNIQVLCSK